MNRMEDIESQVSQENLDQQELGEKLRELEMNMHRIEEKYSKKIQQLKILNKSADQKSLKLTKEMMQLKQKNQDQKEDISKIQQITEQNQSKFSTPRMSKKSTFDYEDRGEAGSPNHRAGMKKSTQIFKKTDNTGRHQLKKSVEIKTSPRGSPRKFDTDKLLQEGSKEMKTSECFKDKRLTMSPSFKAKISLNK